MQCLITVQETKLGKKGLIKLKAYQFFQRTRLIGQGGRLLIAFDQDLHPVLVSSCDDDAAEVITVQVKAGDTIIRIINANGP